MVSIRFVRAERKKAARTSKPKPLEARGSIGAWNGDGLWRWLQATPRLNHGHTCPQTPKQRAEQILSLDCSSAHHLSYLATVARASLSNAAPSKPASLERLTQESITTSA